MQTSHLIRSQRLATTLLLIGFPILINLASAQQSNLQSADETANFRAIFFLQGDLVKKIPELARMNAHPSVRNTNQRRQGEIRHFQDGIVRDIQKRDEAWFTRFNDALKSGDRGRISRELNQGAQMIDEITSQDRKLAQERDKIRTGWIADQKSTNQASKVVVEVDKAVVTLYPPLSYTHWNLTSNDSSESRLLRESLVNSLSTTLKSEKVRAQ